MINWFAKNSVAANLLMFTIILAGVLSIITELKVEVFPSSAPDIVRVSVPLRGATPEDIELGVASKIEQAVQDLEGLDKITSRSVEGSTTVTLEVDSDYDPREILDDVKNRIDSINTFPLDAEQPVISLATRKFSVIEVVVAGEYNEEEILLQAEKVRDDLLRTNTISQVEISSVRNYEIAVEASQDKLREFGLTLADLSNAIRNSSLDLSAGNLRTAAGDVLIRSKGQAYRQSDFDAIVVKTNIDGTIIRLKDIASVNDSFEEESITTRFNGKQAAFIRVYRVGNQSAIRVADTVKNYIEQQQNSLPVGVSLSYWDDDSQMLRDRLGLLRKNAIQGGILVIVLLTLFLRPAVAIWVFIGIPVSFLGSFIFLSQMGFSLNLISAFAFILVLGIVVDDAIVTGENVYSHLRTGKDGLSAAIDGTKEVAIPVTFGVLTTMVAFAPLAFVEGRLGALVGTIPAVVMPVLFFSLIESKFVLPAHLKHIRLPKTEKPAGGFRLWQQNFANGFEENIKRYYLPILKRATDNRYATLAAFLGILILIISLLMSGWSRFTFFPRIVSETATASLTMPVGTPFEVTDQFLRQISDAAEKLQNDHRDPNDNHSPIVNILSVTGSTGGRSTNGSHKGVVQFEVTPAEERGSDITTTQLVNEWRRVIGDIPGAESLTFRAEIFRPGDPIDIQFSGNSLEELSGIGEKVKQHLATYPGVFEISDSLSDGKEELHIELTDQGHVMGLTRSDIVSQVGQAFKGLEAQRVQRGRDDIRVLVRFPQSERRSLSGLNEMLITTPMGTQIPLSHVATLRPDKGPTEITRINLFRVLNVTADIEKENVNLPVLLADVGEYIDEMLLQHPGVTYSLEGEAKEQRDSFGSLQAGIIAILFIIYCLLALPLRSYIQPIIVMSVMPFGLIGAAIGHWLMGFDMSTLSLFGLLALTGVLVNDSLVLVDYINQQRKKGGHLLDIVHKAGTARFRPVFLTSMTTFFGLMPLILETSTSAQFLIPMAISLAFGILFATVITLVLIPINILIVEDIRLWIKRIFSDDKSITQNS